MMTVTTIHHKKSRREGRRTRGKEGRREGDTRKEEAAKDAKALSPKMDPRLRANYGQTARYVQASVAN